MKFTDIFIRRPVLASVVSLMLLVIGLRSVELLPVLQYPRTQNAVVTVQTVYTGADANLVAGFITTPLENSIAQANGIDYMTSQSTPNVSVITASLRLNYVMSQDAYGASTQLSLGASTFAVPNLAIGRLVETAAEASGMLDAYLNHTTNGVVATPTSSATSIARSITSLRVE